MTEMREKIAQALWHRFAPEQHMEWETERHKAEYLDAADGVLALLSQSEPERGDAICEEADGCPTEKAVLQRFWRQHHAMVEKREKTIREAFEHWVCDEGMSPEAATRNDAGNYVLMHTHLYWTAWQAAAAVLLSQSSPSGEAETPSNQSPQEGMVLSRAARDVFAERRRQVEAEGWTIEHDDEHRRGEMALAASAYIHDALGFVTYSAADNPDLTSPTVRCPPNDWPWDRSWWKPKGRRRDLVRAGALIIAEIERLDRASSHSQEQEKGV